MTLTKRTRFEVLRRDDYTCRYCGGRAPDVKLTVDHVTPVALGGTDDPANLVAACSDCNAGKGSTGPDEATVADVAADAMRWSRAIAAAAAFTAQQASAAEELENQFIDRWVAREGQWRKKHLPEAWRATVAQITRAGLPAALLVESVDIAFDADPRDHWSYFCGIAWKKVRQIQELAQTLIDSEEAGGA